MAWCKLEDTFHDHWKPKRLALALKVSRAEARGLIAALWSWAVSHAPDGDLSQLTETEIEEAADWEGCAGDFVRAACLGHVSVLDRSECGLVIHGFSERTESRRLALKKKNDRDRRKADREVSQDTLRTVPISELDSRGTVSTTGKPVNETVARREEKRREEKIREEERRSEDPVPPPDFKEAAGHHRRIDATSVALHIGTHRRLLESIRQRCAPPNSTAGERRAVESIIEACGGASLGVIEHYIRTDKDFYKQVSWTLEICAKDIVQIYDSFERKGKPQKSRISQIAEAEAKRDARFAAEVAEAQAEHDAELALRAAKSL